MVVAIASAVGLVLAVLLGHVLMDLMNARRDYQFYAEVARVRASLRETPLPGEPPNPPT